LQITTSEKGQGLGWVGNHHLTKMISNSEEEDDVEVEEEEEDDVDEDASLREE
jgi:hypothetical protein